LKLSVCSTQEEFKVSKTRLVLTLRGDSNTNWYAKPEVKHRDIVGTPSKDRMGLGNSKQSQWNTAEPHLRRPMFQHIQ